MLSFKEKLYENEVEGSKVDLVEIFNDLLDAADSDGEYKLYDMLLSFVETGVFAEEIYPVLFDLVERIVEIEKEDTEEGYTFKPEELSELVKRVVRGGKMVRKKVCGKGKKAKGGKCVIMTSGEKRSRAKAAVKSHKKSKSARKKGSKKAARSRKRFNV